MQCALVHQGQQGECRVYHREGKGITFACCEQVKNMREDTINQYSIKGKDYLRFTLAGSVPGAENNAVGDDITVAEDLERITAKA